MLRDASSELVLAADVDGDHKVTQAELRAAHYRHQLEKNVQQIVVSNVSYNCVRHAPWLVKAIQKRKHSELVWRGSSDQDKTVNSKNIEATAIKDEKKDVETSDTPQGQFTIWDAVIEGSVEKVKNFIKENKIDIRSYHEKRSGQTLLHHAAWNGHVKLIKFILEYIEMTHGQQACFQVVNTIDTAHNKVTPIIEACRTIQGLLNDRLESVKILLKYGALVDHQDCYGDNALHWAARRSCLSVVRHLLKCSDAAVFAAVADNYKLEKPLDIAKRQLDKCPGMQTVEIYNLLQNAIKGCNMRLKIQSEKKHLKEEDEIAMANKKNQELLTLENTRLIVNRAKTTWTDLHVEAETFRAEIENSKLKAASNEAIKSAQLWIDSKEGKAYVKRECKAAGNEIKDLVQKGEMSRPKDLKKASIARVKELFFLAKENEAKKVAQDEFRSHNPPIVSFDIMELKKLFE